MPVKMVVTYRRQNRKEAAIRRHRNQHFYSQGRPGRINHIIRCEDCRNWQGDLMKIDKADLYYTVVR